ncbi:flagellar hook-associated protein FlgL [Fluoribacter dumoffii]|uniref:Hook-filament junction protein n=1 Tax=Fluoribacter dumoffii TaxID=463 RepID=A0A377GA38_9GAMM|nr:flagellar hook-associated protein FlgL [Fluoribacter dumoffii]KTC88924.1 flagellar hook-associated protein FlgL [Fluoribacter dumoffii NY 23]MCW8385864.1 flagellar hook-associated protein FlgL [Fluoribacter dumoffii]MCW8418917.1 flagellar hook-associated protein FlgL [Fluoribacter dumoffii]MCW8453239.1 flagellar hook-associated protein FlgL [Fluoribacter dumoffii]MCW8459540.1 flagellar hook-associated protein FlgL [Fluoribacter dumoffii]
MRISTNQIYQNSINRLLLKQEQVAKLQERIDENFVKVRYSSDDPIAFSQIELMNQRISFTELLQKNRESADNALSMEESVLNDCTTSLQRLRDIQVKAGNATLSEGDRKALAIEANIILNELLNYANTKDINGDYMFGGGQTSTLPFTINTLGQYVYNGDNTQRFQLVGSSLQMAINDPGDGLFMRIPNGNGSFAIRQTGTPNTGTASLDPGSISNPSAYVADNYTLSFTLNSQGNLVVMVSGAVTGNVIPPTGLPDDAPLYQEGMTVNFNGMEMTVSGTPAPGDAFSITPSQNESVFATIQEMINNLNQPFSTASEKAAATTLNNQILAQIESALTTILDARANLGSRLNQLEHADTANADLIEQSRITLKRLQEVDPLVAASEYKQELYNLEIAQQSFVLIQGLSLFNFI